LPRSAQQESRSNIIDKLDSLNGFDKELVKVLSVKVSQKVLDSLNEAEKNIQDMEQELIALYKEVPSLKSKDNFFNEYNEATSYLRQSRQDFRELAHRTVSEIRDLKIVLEDLDQNSHPVLLKIMVFRMKDLMIETQQRLEVAKEKYELARLAFENLNSFVKKQNGILDAVVTQRENKYLEDKRYTETVRTNCAIAFIFTLGLCSLIHHYENEVPLETARGKLRNLQTITAEIVERGDTLNQDISKAIEFLSEEIDLINRWAVSADIVSKNIDRYSVEYLEKYKVIRVTFTTGLDALKKVAEQFVD